MPEFLNKNEQFQPEGVPEELPSSPSGMDKEPIEEELESYRNMTREEWDARVVQGKQETADIMAEREEAAKEQREEWERKIKALESVEPTGDIIEDAKALFKAADINSDELDSRYGGAFEKGDRTGIMKYFKDLERTAGMVPPSGRDYVVKHYIKFDEVVKKIISAAEFTEEKEKLEKSKE